MKNVFSKLLWKAFFEPQHDTTINTNFFPISSSDRKPVKNNQCVTQISEFDSSITEHLPRLKIRCKKEARKSLESNNYKIDTIKTLIDIIDKKWNHFHREMIVRSYFHSLIREVLSVESPKSYNEAMKEIDTLVENPSLLTVLWRELLKTSPDSTNHFYPELNAI
ncbi:hypothetical protein TetV_031 [Tetraselmis virus 1]|uniref:Uncharacterized protein n=1 Tax=Tetraselmis virus 1 TaxID=2060617 RepID=A0A2P0VML6_9VIRU|nr:hypothetical protein QJ968_gp031 [Tetraselmis virus 1]AUF82123.1 hypothetical protein TetV_031 [Tetraselmis virus 1]